MVPAGVLRPGPAAGVSLLSAYMLPHRHRHRLTEQNVVALIAGPPRRTLPRAWLNNPEMAASVPSRSSAARCSGVVLPPAVSTGPSAAAHVLLSWRSDSWDTRQRFNVRHVRDRLSMTAGAGRSLAVPVIHVSKVVQVMPDGDLQNIRRGP